MPEHRGLCLQMPCKATQISILWMKAVMSHTKGCMRSMTPGAWPLSCAQVHGMAFETNAAWHVCIKL